MIDDPAPPPPAGSRPEVRGLATVGSDIAVVTVARAGGLIAGALTVVVTTRVLGPAGYAEVALATVIATLVFALSSGWTAAAASRYGREELEQRGVLLRTSWARLILSLPLLAAGALVIAAAGAARLLPPELSITLILLAIASGAFLTSSEHIVVALEAAGRMRASALALLLRSLLVAAAIGVVALTAQTVSPETVVGIGAAAGAVLTLVTARLVWRTAMWPPEPDRAAIRRVLWFSAPMIAFAASQYGMRAVDVVILRAFEPAAVVGVYAVAFQAFVMLAQLTTTITIVVTPLFVSLRAAGREHELRRYASRIVPQATLLLGIAVGVAAPLAALLVPVVLGSEFAGAADPLVILLVALLLQALASLAAPVLMLHERSRATAALSVLALGVNVAGDLALVGLLGAGVVGPAVATVSAMLPLAVGYLAIAARAVGARPRFPAAVWIAPFAGVAAALALPPGLAVPASVAGAVIGIALAVSGGLFAAEDADLVERLGLPAALRRRLIERLRARGG